MRWIKCAASLQTSNRLLSLLRLPFGKSETKHNEEHSDSLDSVHFYAIHFIYSYILTLNDHSMHATKQTSSQLTNYPLQVHEGGWKAYLPSGHWARGKLHPEQVTQG